MKKHLVGIGLVLACATGCATKNHGRLVPVSDVERTQLTCRELDIEISKCNEFMKAISENSKIDGRSVLGFLGDFGIGNAMERDAAEKSVRTRLDQLNQLKRDKNCP